MYREIRDTVALGVDWLKLERGRSRSLSRTREQVGAHLALFAWALPPNSNAGVYRPLSFIKYGTELGWTIDAFHGEAPLNQKEHGEELVKRLPANAVLHCLASENRRYSYRLFPSIDGGFSDAVAYAKCAVQRLTSNPPDVVLASGPPFFVFVAGYFVARHFGVPLVLDYRDEWTECPFGFVQADGDDLRWERRCLSAASAVFFTTRSHLEHQLATFPELSRDRVHLVPNGWDASDFSGAVAAPVARPTRERMVLSHVGNLAGHTSPKDFLLAVKDLFEREPAWRDRLEIHFVGRRSTSAQKHLDAFAFKSNIVLVDHVGKAEAAARMRDADALLLLACPELERYLPGKLFDYVASGRPVIVFGHPGEASRALEGIGAGMLCLPGSGLKLRGKLEEALDWSPDVRHEERGKWLSAHRRDHLATQAFGLLSDVARKGTV
jgi:glycosyltransferase involved in cell wall biosynthesis